MEILNSSVLFLTYLVYYNIFSQRFVDTYILRWHIYCKQKQKNSDITFVNHKKADQKISAKNNLLSYISLTGLCKKVHISLEMTEFFSFSTRRTLQKFIMLHSNANISYRISGMLRCKDLLLFICCSSVTGKLLNSASVIIISQVLILKQSH